MQITDVKINGMRNPIGYEYKNPRISWKVRDTEAKHQTGARIEAAKKARICLPLGNAWR